MTVRADRPLRIVLLGTHGQFNLGDELLLETFLQQLGPGHRYRVNSYAPAETMRRLAGRFDVEAFDTAGESLSLVRHLWSSDVVVFGGGSIVKELYPSTGRWRYATLVMILTIVGFCRFVARRPMLMSNVGVGPITTATGRFLARWILRLVTVVSVRDQRSYRTCRELGCRSGKVRLVPDAVWANGPEVFHPGSIDREPSAGRPFRIALNLNRDIENGVNWEPFLDALEQALRQVAAHTEIELHALPMQCRFKEHHDLEVLEEFLVRMPEVVSFVHRPDDHADVGSILAGCDMIVAERLHALVIAATLGRPAVALIYDVKVRELVDQLGLADRAVDINHPFDPETLAAVIEAASVDLEAEGARLADRAEELRREVTAQFEAVRGWLDDPSQSSWPVSEPAEFLGV